MRQALLSEFLGTSLLLATVVGSGIMGDSLSGGNIAIALLANAIATGAILFVLIHLFGPLSGAHFNPAVTVTMWSMGRIEGRFVIPFFVVQCAGAVFGVVLAHAMFDQSLLQVSQKMRWSEGQWISEAVATFGLLLTILGLVRHKPEIMPQAVALYIVGAYWFTASTSFANPAVTLARSLSDTFAGIAPSSVLPFIVAQGLGAGAAVLAARILFAEKS